MFKRLLVLATALSALAVPAVQGMTQSSYHRHYARHHYVYHHYRRHHTHSKVVIKV